jgi:predicted Zn-dependent protease
VLAFLVVLGIGWSMGGSPDAGSVPTRTVLVQVHQGETLWGVAQRMAPSAAPAAVVTKIRQLNSLDVDTVLYPGELLKVPTGLSADAAAKAGAVQR